MVFTLSALVATVKSKDIPQDSVVDAVDEDTHDYEYIDEEELDFIRKKFHEEAILRNTVKGKPNTF